MNSTSEGSSTGNGSRHSDIFDDCCTALADAATAGDKLKIFEQAAYDVGLAIADSEIDRDDGIDSLFEIGHSYDIAAEDAELQRIVGAQFRQADGDRQAERERERAEQQQEHENETGATEHDEEPPLPYVDLAAELTERQWLVADRIPMFNVTSLSGEGSVGKSILLLQLSAACVLGRDWIGTLPVIGPVLYFCAEEDADEIRRRLEAIALHFGISRQQLSDGGLRVLSFAGREAILGTPDRDGIIKPTPLFERIKSDATAQRPKLIVIDPVADAFGGNEIDRAQTRQYITHMRGLAIDAGSAVVMATHPSLTGIASGSGTSGSTAWHNSVRARLYLQAAPSDDKALRVLEVKKNNYGPVTDTVVLRWKDGVYIVEPGKGTLQRLADEQAVDHLFIKLLRRLVEQDRNVSHLKGPTYAPKVFASRPEAREAKVTSKDFAEGMERLFAAKRIKVVTDGPPSRRRTRIIEVTLDDPSNCPSDPPSNRLPTAFQPPSNRFQPPSHTHPLYP